MKIWACALLFLALPLDAGPKRVVISTDLALGLQGGWRLMNDPDDGWAVAMALNDPGLNVRLVATVFGNSHVAAEDVVSRRLIRDLMRSRVARASGAAVALDNPFATLNGQPLPGTCENDAVRTMRRVLGDGRATIIAIGPLTDITCLVLNGPPSAVKKIDEVIAIMGRSPNQAFSIGTVTGLTDFNVVMDSRALRVLLDSSVPITFLQFDLTRQILVRRELVASWSKGTPLRRFIHDATMPWIDFWQNTFGEDGFHPWDSNAVWYASRPEAFSCRDVSFVLQPCSKDKNDPYNRLGGCAGHSPDQKPSLDKETVQLWLGTDVSSSRMVRTCTGYSSAQERERFERAIAGSIR